LPMRPVMPAMPMRSAMMSPLRQLPDSVQVRGERPEGVTGAAA
jgi:hypothetical protein